jgi:superfamily II DNA or RNA helicase
MVFAAFKELPLSHHYNSDECDVMRDFYRPIIERSVRYDRAVGYFSSTTLRACARELATFIHQEGRIRFVIGCLVSDEDAAALKTGEISEADQARIREEIKTQLLALQEQDLDSAVLFSRLIVAGVIDVKFALRATGIYHEKFGVFTDAYGCKVAFIGSANETAAALAAGGNHESFSVFKSWEPEIFAAYGNELDQRFEDLWNGRTKNTRIHPLDEDSLTLMRSIAEKNRVVQPKEQPVLQALDARSALRPYQQQALQEWKANSYSGILAMATGTGKTLTAIEAVKRFRAAVPGGAVVITVPYQNLALQWLEALREQGIDVVPVFDGYSKWADKVKNYMLASQATVLTSIPCFVCVNDTFKEDRFQDLLVLLRTTFEPNHLLIADECHHFNSPDHLKKLPGYFNYRLGLSATPYDQFAQRYLDHYFGKVVFEFPLRRAINEGFLTAYRYHVIPVTLDEDETETYEEITYRIVRIAGRDDGFTPETLAKVQPLLLARARIVGAARDKLDQLERHLIETGRKPFTLFYCGDGALEEAGTRQRQIELVTQLLHRLGWRSSRITAEENLRQRESALDALRRQSIDAVVSIKVLDEGIDVPSCRTAYLLASQSSDRQGIQRRGRVLRKSEDKELAELYDFLVIGASKVSRSIQSLTKKELRRAWSFAADAFNQTEIQTRLRELANQCGINVESLDGDQQSEQQ